MIPTIFMSASIGWVGNSLTSSTDRWFDRWGDHDDGLDLDDARVVARLRAEEVRGDGRAQVGGADKVLHDVLGEDEGREVVLDVVVGDVDVLETERDVGRRDGADPPVRLAQEDLVLVRGRRDDVDLVAGDVGGPRLDGGDLRGGLGRLLDLGHLLALDGRRGDLHSEDDITDLGARERRGVDGCRSGGSESIADKEGGSGRTVALGVVAEDQVAKGDLDSHPLVVLERRPDVVRRRDGVLVGPEDDLGLLVVDVDGSEEEDEAGEGRVRRDRLEPVVVEVGEHHLGLTRSEDLKGTT